MTIALIVLLVIFALWIAFLHRWIEQLEKRIEVLERIN